MLIIADDITGAAEIAGIAWRKGLKVNLRLSGHKVATLSGYEDLKTSRPQNLKTSITVIATDTRSGTEEEAVKTIEDLFAPSTSPLQGGAGGGLIFKKTDSVLRGHVAAELQALMRVSGKQKALLIPQNPSKGRIVKDGIYYINGVPLHETSFRYDPEFPATTSLVNKLISRRVDELCASENSGHSITNNLSTCQLDNLSTEISLPDATTIDEISEHVAKAGNDTLFAGGADMFEAVVDCLLGVRSADNSLASTPSSPNSHPSSTTIPLYYSSPKGELGGGYLLLCGSTQSRSLIAEPFFADKNAVEVTMPEDVFHGAPADEWIATLKNHWQNHEAMIVRIGHDATGGKEYAVRLRNLFGELAYQVLSPDQGVQTLPDQGVQECRSEGVQTLPPSTSNLSTCQLKQATCQLVNSSTCQLAKHSTRQLVNLSTCEALNSSTYIIIEGGATAYTVLQRLGISSFDVEYEYSTGVVCLSHGNMRIILKPGSYPWGNLF